MTGESQDKVNPSRILSDTGPDRLRDGMAASDVKG
jgi:hypothetical protein